MLPKGIYTCGRVQLMENGIEKTMYEMDNRELFCVLTGDRGVMAQMFLQEVVKEYLKGHKEEADLKTMVRTVVDGRG